MSRAVKISEELVNDAEVYSKSFNRSIASQIEFWTKIVLLRAVLRGWYAFFPRNVVFLRIFAYFCSPFLEMIINYIKNR